MLAYPSPVKTIHKPHLENITEVSKNLKISDSNTPKSNFLPRISISFVNNRNKNILQNSRSAKEFKIGKKSPMNSRDIPNLASKDFMDWTLEKCMHHKNLHAKRENDGLIFINNNFKVNFIVAFKKRNCIIVAGMDCEIIIYDYETGRKVSSVFGHSKAVTCLDLDPSETFLVSGSFDQSIRISNLSKSSPSSYEIGRHKGIISCLIVDWDRKKLVSWGRDSSIRLWDINSKTLESELFLDQQELLSLMFFSNTKILASSKNASIHYFYLNLNTNSIQKSDEIIPIKFKGTINCMTLFNKTKRIALGSSDKTINLIDVESNYEAFKFTGHKSSVISMIISIDDMFLISGDQKGQVRIWKLDELKVHRIIEDHQGFVTSLALDYEKKILIIGGADCCCGVWDFQKIIM